MRIAIIDSVTTPEAAQNTTCIVKAYQELGHEVKLFEYRGKVGSPNQAVNAIILWKPEYIHMGKCETFTDGHLQTMKAHTKAFISHSYLDQRPCGFEQWVANIATQTDVTFFGHRSEERIKQYMDAGANKIRFTTEGFNCEYIGDQPPSKEYEFDFVFMGSNQHMDLPGYQLRREILEYAAKNYKLLIHGYDWEYLESECTVRGFVTGYEYIEEVRRALYCIDVHSCFDMPNATSRPRTLRYLASGRNILSSVHKTIYEEFPCLKPINRPEDLDLHMAAPPEPWNPDGMMYALRYTWPKILQRHIDYVKGDLK